LPSARGFEPLVGLFRYASFASMDQVELSSERLLPP